MYSPHFNCHLQRGEEHLARQLLPGLPAAQSQPPARGLCALFSKDTHSLSLLLRANSQVSPWPPRASGLLESHSQVCSLPAIVQRRGTQGGARHRSGFSREWPQVGSGCSTDRGYHTRVTFCCGGHVSRQK